MSLVSQQYGAQARDEVYSKAVETTFSDAVVEHKFRVAGFPNIEHKPFAEAAKELEYIATFEIIPEVKLGDVKKVKVEKPTLKVAVKDIDKTIDVLVKQRVSYSLVKRASKKADRINIDLTASIDGEEVESTGNKGMDIVLGEVGRIESFDKELTQRAMSQKSWQVKKLTTLCNIIVFQRRHTLKWIKPSLEHWVLRTVTLRDCALKSNQV